MSIPATNARSHAKGGPRPQVICFKKKASSLFGRSFFLDMKSLGRGRRSPIGYRRKGLMRLQKRNGDLSAKIRKLEVLLRNRQISSANVWLPEGPKAWFGPAGRETLPLRETRVDGAPTPIHPQYGYLITPRRPGHADQLAFQRSDAFDKQVSKVELEIVVIITRYQYALRAIQQASA